MPKTKPDSSEQERQPWERLEQESDSAFEAFAMYRDMGADRSLAKVGRQVGKHKTLMERWSSKYSWGLRCRGWDEELDRQAREERIVEVLDMRRRQANLGRALQGLASKGLRQMTTTTDAEGKTVPIDPRLSAAEIARLAKDGALLERLALGEPGDILETRDSDPDNAVEREVQRLLDDPDFRKRLDREGARARGSAVKPRKSRRGSKRRKMDKD